MAGKSPEGWKKVRKAALLSLPAIAIAAGEVALQKTLLLPNFNGVWDDLRNYYHQTEYSSLSPTLAGNLLGKIIPVALWGVGGVFGAVAGGVTAEYMYGNLIGVFPDMPDSNNGGPVGFLRDALKMMRRWNGLG